MKQEKPEIIKKGQEKLAELKKLRGSVFGMHNRIANDPRLLESFIDQFKSCNSDASAIPAKYRELIVMAIGSARNAETTTKVHAKNAYELGATIEELGEVLRIIFFTCGVTSLIPASEIFDEIPEMDGDND
ncbi:MAG: carboxymuconolactone decarboxylase family protein [Treponema sp.]|jgi:alkylhydroperoxidase/carboxymuconolactone decarboxylase family protein YurZ|nr:carboxymuconolactone decarboxylase family protein [Treponema sp.]